MAGPFLGELGFELLYWIPFLRRLVARLRISPEQLTVVARGGSSSFYTDLADYRIDATEHWSNSEWDELVAARRIRAGDAKQLAIDEVDLCVLDRALGSGWRGSHLLVHPSIMYGALRQHWAGRLPLRDLERRITFSTIALPAAGCEAPVGLPRPYVCLKLYESAMLPHDPRATAFTTAIIERLCARTNVVVLSMRQPVDGHRDHDVQALPVRWEPGCFPGPTHLDAYARVLAGSQGLVSTYGGFSYLGPLLGVPTVAVASGPVPLDVHRKVAGRMADAMCVPWTVMTDMEPNGLTSLDALTRG